MQDRLTKLQTMLQRQPGDTFLLYALAMEHKKLNNPVEALASLQRVLDSDPAYVAAYHQAAIIHEQSGNATAARDWYRQGISAATRAGNAHAAEEMSAALALLET